MAGWKVRWYMEAIQRRNAGLFARRSPARIDYRRLGHFTVKPHMQTNVGLFAKQHANIQGASFSRGVNILSSFSAG
jgi:hypothetical protein